MPAEFTRLEIRGWRQFRRVELAFHPHLTIITGANGAGKTTLLNLLGRHFGWNITLIATSRLTKRGVYRFYSGVLDHDESSLEPSAASREIGRISYTTGADAILNVPAEVQESFDVSVSNQQHVEGVFLPSHRAVYSYLRVDQIPTQIDAREQLFDQFYSNLRSMYEPRTRFDSPSYRLKAALISLATFGYGNQAVERNPQAIATFEGFQEALAKVLPPTLGFQRLAIRVPEVVVEAATGDFSLDAASGGIATIIDVTWQLYMKSLIVENFVAVCDEPENHLHPALQRTIMPGLVQAFPSAQFIVATHNPFVVTSVEDSNVFVIDYIDDLVESSRLEEVDRSASANQVLRDVLGVPVPVPLWVESRIEDIVSRFEGRALSEAVLGELRAEMATVHLDHLFPEAIGQLMTREPNDTLGED